MDSDVLIVGAAPTGLTLAIDLGKRGVRNTGLQESGKNVRGATTARSGISRRA